MHVILLAKSKNTPCTWVINNYVFVRRLFPSANPTCTDVLV